MTNTVGDASSSTIATVTSKDGSFYSGDSKTNLSTLMMNLMIHRVQSVDGVLSGMINEMNDNNRQTKLMNDYLAGLRDLRPTKSAGTVSHSNLFSLVVKIKRHSVDADHPRGTDIDKAWGLNLNSTDPNIRNKTYTQSEIDQKIEIMKSKISGVNSNQQMAQIKLEKYNNVRNESMQMVSTIMKSSTQLLQSIINNMG